MLGRYSGLKGSCISSSGTRVSLKEHSALRPNDARPKLPHSSGCGAFFRLFLPLARGTMMRGDIMTDVKALLKTLRSGLAPVVEEVLKRKAAETGQDWLKLENDRRAAKGLRELSLRFDGSLWDPMDLLQTIKGDLWPSLQSIFTPKNARLSDKEKWAAYDLAKGRINEILNGRHDWAHFNDEQFDYLAQTCALLLRSCGCEKQAKLIETKRSVSSCGAEPLIQRASSSTNIRLIRVMERGLELEEPDAVERISPGEKIRIELNLVQAKAHLRFGVVLIVDPVEVACLLPSPRIASNAELQRPVQLIPDPQTTDLALRFKGTLGRHIVLALLTRTKLPQEVYSALDRPQPRGFLDRVEEVVQKLQPDDWYLMKMEFDVG
jgi:hypothetical protein